MRSSCARCLALAAFFFLPLGAQAAKESAAVSFLLGATLSGDGEIGEALQSFSQAIALAPEDPYIRLAYAELLAQTGQLDPAAAEVGAARKLAPNEPAVHRLEARIAMQRSDRDPSSRIVAREAFERWLEGEPDDLEALVTVGQLYLGESQFAKAVEVLERASSLRPGQPMIESLRGRALVLAGEPDRAEAVQRALLRDHPERLEVRFELAEALSLAGRPGEAAVLLAQAPAEQAGSPELRRRRAIASLLAGDLDQARVLSSELVIELPENSTVRLLAATIERADGRWERVIELIAPVASRLTATESSVALYVEALERLDRLDAALEFLDQRVAVLGQAGRPDDAFSSGLQAADLALRRGRVEEAERRARSLAALPPGDAETERLRRNNVAWLLSDCAMARADWDAAREPIVGLALPAARARLYEIASRSQDLVGALSIRTGLERGGGDELMALAEADLRLERFADSVSHFRRLTVADPTSVRARFGLASALERLGMLDESEVEFETILARHPDHAPSLNYLGYMWIESSRNLEQAVGMVSRAVRVDPSNAAYVDSLGWGLYRLGRAEEAARLLERAARLEPDDATILEHLGDAWVSAGDFVRARAAYERALAVSGAGGALSAKIARLPGSGGVS